jgi:hypothetical protein
MPLHERSEVQRRFNRDGVWLLAPDAAAEGLNLHGRCRLVVNYELPWNPTRLEQRIGRVDRVGQLRAVHALTLVARDTAEDLVIAKLARRLQRIAATLGERDRLAAFLDEARTAQIVIGAASVDDMPPPASLPAIVRAARDADTAPTDEAARLTWIRTIRRPRESTQVAVSRIGTAQLDAGFVFAVHWAAATVDGTEVDTDISFVHVAGNVPEGRHTAARVRVATTAAVHEYGAAVRALAAAGMAERFAAASAIHQRIVDSRHERELALISLRQDATLFQPGLFDGRATQRATDDGRLESLLREEHERRLATLQHTRSLESRNEIVGVLLVSPGSRA